MAVAKYVKPSDGGVSILEAFARLLSENIQVRAGRKEQGRRQGGGLMAGPASSVLLAATSTYRCTQGLMRGAFLEDWTRSPTPPTATANPSPSGLQELLRTMYDLFNAKARTKELPLAQWLSLLESANLMGGSTNVLAGTGGESRWPSGCPC